MFKTFLVVSAVLSLLQGYSQTKQNAKPNVLFIMVDDLRPELGCYGASQIKSPNINKLASQAVQFNRAYCNIPVCGASRASLLTGILPTRNRFVQYNAKVSKDAPKAKTLPQIFKESGYQTYSAGKVFHDSQDTESRSWSEPTWNYNGKDYDFMLSRDPSTMAVLSKKQRGRIYEMPDVADDAYNDGQIALKTIEYLKKQKESGKPFFLSCGFIRPHLPFYAPKKYWDMYDRETIEIADNPYKAKNAPKSLNSGGEFRNYHFGGLKPKTDAFRRMMTHGYFASVSYTDKLIGDVLATLKSLELDENTIVVLWGDHGWNVGEHDFWGKHNTTHVALRVPLLIKVPRKATNGSQTAAIVESVDIFPTLCELAKIKAPSGQLQGKSFANVLDTPKTDFREYAYSRFLGADAVVTDCYAYTHYTGKRDEVMLFDHNTDPDENVNVVALPKYKKLVKKMEKYLKEAKKRAVIEE